MYTVIVKHIC